MRALLASAFLLLAFAAPAGAAEIARGDGATLSASDERGDLCVDLSLDEPSEGGGVGSFCSDPPVRAFGTMIVNASGAERTIVGGATPAGVARVEAERDDGVRFGAETVAGERYRGRHAGKVRFFLVSVPKLRARSTVPLLRLFDATGALVGAVEPDYSDRASVAGPVRVLSQRPRGASLVVRASAERSLAPTPLALDRLEDEVCLSVAVRQRREPPDSGGVCQSPGPFRPPLSLGVHDACGALRPVLYGFVGSAVTGVRLRLGSGRRITVPVRTLPASIAPGQRFVAATLPRHEAVRSASAIGVRAGEALGQPPGGLPCDPNSASFGVYAPYLPPAAAPRPDGPDQQVAAEADGHRLLVRDADAERLCVGLDSLRADSGDCGLPPVDASLLVVEERAGMASAVVPADVVRVRLPSGLEVPTVPGDAYTGRYAGRVRFLLAAVPRGSTGTLRFYDAAGVLLGRGFITPVDPPPVAGPVTLARGRGWRLGAVNYGHGGCVARAGQLGPEACFADFGRATSAYLSVSCRPRVALLYGTLNRRTRGVAVRLRGGRRMRARVIRVPRRIGGGRAFVLALPRRAEVRSITAGPERVSLTVLPAARQCGYVLGVPGLPSGSE